jgi:hypothetical protein
MLLSQAINHHKLVPPYNGTDAQTDMQRDFKYFVDQPLKGDARQTQAKFDAQFGGKRIAEIDREELYKFLMDNFDPAAAPGGESSVGLET